MVVWKCPVCKVKVKTLGRVYPAMHWCKKQSGKYLPLEEQDADND